MDNVEEKLKHLEEWNNERTKVKPFIDMAVDYHNKASIEAHWKNYEEAARLYRNAIKNYKNAVSQNPKFYLKDLLERIDRVIEEHVNNSFNLKISGNRLKDEKGIWEFTDFIDSLKMEEKSYIENYDIAQAFLHAADFYYLKKLLKLALEFYNAKCSRPYVNREVHFKMGRIFFEEARFKEALVSFVSVLSFDRSNEEVISCIEDCLKKLKILEYRNKFIKATPHEATKLIMEVL